MDDCDFKNWISKRKEFITELGLNYNNWYLSNDDIKKILCIFLNEINFCVTQNGLVPKHVPIRIIKLIIGFEKYKVTFFISRSKRLSKLTTSELKSNTRYNCFLRYGKIAGCKFYNDKNKKSIISLENLINKYGEEEGTKRYNMWYNARVNPLLTFQRKYGEEEGTKRYNMWCERNKGNHSLERLISIYGEEEGTERFLGIRDRLKFAGTINYYINKYGEEKGTERYNDKISKLHFGSSLERVYTKIWRNRWPKTT